MRNIVDDCDYIYYEKFTIKQYKRTYFGCNGVNIESVCDIE